jgi:hypothetical protein
MDRQFPGIRRVLAFFGEAGIRTELSEQGCFWINGGQAPPLASLVRHTSTGIAWDDIIDQIAMTYARRELINAVWDNARFGNSVRVFLRPEDNEFAIMSGDAKLAAIRATGAHFPQHDVIKANFLTAGPHWQQAVRAVREAESRLPAESEREQAAKFDALAAAAAARRRAAEESAKAAEWERDQKAKADALAAAARRRAAEESAKAAEWERDQKAKADALAAAAAARRRAAEESAKAADKADEKAPERRWTNARRLISGLPDSLPAQLVDACLAASQRIRLERQLAYERPVILQYPLGELTLWPVAGSGTRLVVPFQFKEGPRTIKADLILGSRDPLAVLIDESVGQGDAIKAWVCALLGFADATCIDLVAASSALRHHAPRSPQSSGSSTLPRLPSMPGLPPKRRWPSHLQPVGHWVRYSGSLVAAHRRVLHDGRTASQDAIQRAHQVGIILRAGETWVRAHTRGIPDDVEMRFRWSPPAEFSRP